MRNPSCMLVNYVDIDCSRQLTQNLAPYVLNYKDFKAIGDKNADSLFRDIHILNRKIGIVPTPDLETPLWCTVNPGRQQSVV